MRKGSALGTALGIMDSIFEWLGVLCLVAFCVCVVLQVFFRYCLQAPLIWSEEAARLLNMWAVFIGAALVTRRRGHLRVNVVDEILSRISPRAVVVQHLFINFTIAAISAVLFIGAARLTIDRWPISLVTMPAISQGYIFLSLTVSAAAAALYSLLNILENLSVLRGERP